MAAAGQRSNESFRIITARSDLIQRHVNPVKIWRDLWSRRRLISQFAGREVKQLYKGSYFGISWTFISPLLQTLVYTFVFAFIFRARFEGGQSGGPLEYAMGLLAGLAVFEVFRYSLSSAPTQVFRNSNLVTKIVFPLEVLSINDLAPAMTESLTRTLILIVATGILLRQLHWTTLLLPLIYLPLILFSLGASWFVASIGVFFRDIRHLVAILLRVLMFATPIFYSLASVPEPFQSIIALNPLAIFVNDFRRLILWGELPDWPRLLTVSVISFLICWLGYLWFMRTRRLFADVM